MHIESFQKPGFAAYREPVRHNQPSLSSELCSNSEVRARKQELGGNMYLKATMKGLLPPPISVSAPVSRKPSQSNSAENTPNAKRGRTHSNAGANECRRKPIIIKTRPQHTQQLPFFDSHAAQKSSPVNESFHSPPNASLHASFGASLSAALNMSNLPSPARARACAPGIGISAPRPPPTPPAKSKRQDSPPPKPQLRSKILEHMRRQREQSARERKQQLKSSAPEHLGTQKILATTGVRCIPTRAFHPPPQPPNRLSIVAFGPEMGLPTLHVTKVQKGAFGWS
jgi:hypothetical protein